MNHLTVLNCAGTCGVLAEKGGRLSGGRQELGRRTRIRETLEIPLLRGAIRLLHRRIFPIVP